MITEAIQPLKGGRRWCVGDVHGRLDTLVSLLHTIKLTKKDALFLLGDYIDRGPNSKGVLDLLIRLKKSYRIMPLLGNHELMLLMAYNDKEYAKTWKKEYGAETLKSFDVSNVHDIDPLYIHFLLSLPKVTISGEHVLSHAGVNFMAKQPFKDTPENRINTLFRDDAVPDKKGRYRAVIGHKPKTLQQCKESATGPLIHVDAGCGKRRNGALVAYCLDNDEVKSVSN